jgi:hypothetical protein
VSTGDHHLYISKQYYKPIVHVIIIETMDFVKIPETNRQELLDALREGMQHLVFRRVDRVYTKGRSKAFFFHPTITTPWGEKVSIENPDSYPTESYEKRVQEEYYNYFGTTVSLDTRSRYRPAEEEPICFEMKNYSQFDFRTMKFDESEKRYKCRVPPRAMIRRGRKIVRPADLLCGTVKNEGETWYYDKWFVCSEQFLRLWTLITYKEHGSFISLYGSNDLEEMRRKIMSGNRLNTNAYAKWVMTCQQNALNMRGEEMEQRFNIQRTEYISKQWVHMYSAVALLALYGELPNTENIPHNLDGEHHMKRWNLMPSFVYNLLKNHTTLEIDWEELDRYLRQQCIDTMVTRFKPLKQKLPDLHSTQDFPHLQQVRM